MTLAQSRRVVVKIGSAILTANGQGLDGGAVAGLVAQMAALREEGREVVLVSSGAVAAGMSRLGWQQRPHALHELQAAAAVGQMGLIQGYESAFLEYGLHTAQILLDHDDVSVRDRYLNARGTLLTLLSLGVIPVVNENDTVVTEEIRFGDNDTLAALVANLVDADLLVILTDQDGLYDSDPRVNSSATLVRSITAGDSRLAGMAGEGSALGRGGMVTKVKAARLAARSGTHTVIASGVISNSLSAVCAGTDIGTHLLADHRPVTARKQWLAGMVRTNGVLQLDAGATGVVRQSGRSLLPVGVTSVQGQFVRGDMVSCVDPDGREIARGLVNYASAEAGRIIGRGSEDIESVLGYRGEDELIHRDNLVLV